MRETSRRIALSVLVLLPELALASKECSTTNISQFISTIVLTITLIVLILTYLNAHRPYVGIVRSDATYDQAKNELSFTITIKNTGNVTTCGMFTDSKIYENTKVISERKGESSFILFPGQETYGVLKYHGVTKQHIQTNEYFANYLIWYEQPITLGFKRHFKTLQKMRYDPQVGQLKVESGNVV